MRRRVCVSVWPASVRLPGSLAVCWISKPVDRDSPARKRPAPRAGASAPDPATKGVPRRGRGATSVAPLPAALPVCAWRTCQCLDQRRDSLAVKMGHAVMVRRRRSPIASNTRRAAIQHSAHRPVAVPSRPVPSAHSRRPPDRWSSWRVPASGPARAASTPSGSGGKPCPAHRHHRRNGPGRSGTRLRGPEHCASPTGPHERTLAP